MCIGYHNDIITIVGGREPNQGNTIVQYDIAMDTITPFPNTVPVQIYGSGQFWSQSGHNIFMIDPSAPTIHSYDLVTDTFTPDFTNSVIPKADVGFNGCLAAFEDTICVVGGSEDPSRNALQIYTVNDHQWTQGHLLNQKRRAPACIIDTNNEKLYVIGGLDPDFSEIILSSIEYIVTEGIATNDWIYTSNQLSIPLCNARAVSIDQYVYIVGGFYFDSSYDLVFEDTVHVIDTKTNVVSIAPDSLAYPADSVAVIAINNRIYAFGGVNPDTMDTFQYFDAPTSNPTIYPSIPPTQTPSSQPSATPTTTRPTVVPSTIPTMIPTMFPTAMPTMDPTLVPTINPTISPSKAPSLRPSTHPTTTEPTVIPTMAPTIIPTIFPSTISTSAPTLVPTMIPTVVPTLNPSLRTSALLSTYYPSRSLSTADNITFNPSGSAETTSKLSTTDRRYAFRINIFFEFEYENITVSATVNISQKTEQILNDILHNEISNTSDEHCIVNVDGVIVNETQNNIMTIHVMISMCNEEMEQLLLIIYSTNNTLQKDFIDQFETETYLSVVNEIRITFDTINPANIDSTAIKSTNIDSTNIDHDPKYDENEHNNVIYVIILGCLIGILLFSFAVCTYYKLRNRKDGVEHRISLSKQQKKNAIANIIEINQNHDVKLDNNCRNFNELHVQSTKNCATNTTYNTQNTLLKIGEADHEIEAIEVGEKNHANDRANNVKYTTKTTLTTGF